MVLAEVGEKFPGGLQFSLLCHQVYQLCNVTVMGMCCNYFPFYLLNCLILSVGYYRIGSVHTEVSGRAAIEFTSI